jgi:hypothetical protein
MTAAAASPIGEFFSNIDLKLEAAAELPLPPA